jgi:hypothetical protein
MSGKGYQPSPRLAGRGRCTRSAIASSSGPDVHEIQVPEGDTTRWPAEFREAPLDMSPVADDAVGRAGGARQPAVGAPTDPFEHCRRHILQIRIDGSSQVVSCC